MPMTRWEFKIVPCLAGGNASATCLKMLVRRFPMCNDLRLWVCFGILRRNIKSLVIISITCNLRRQEFVFGEKLYLRDRGLNRTVQVFASIWYQFLYVGLYMFLHFLIFGAGFRPLALAAYTPLLGILCVHLMLNWFARTKYDGSAKSERVMSPSMTVMVYLCNYPTRFFKHDNVEDFPSNLWPCLCRQSYIHRAKRNIYCTVKPSHWLKKCDENYTIFEKNVIIYFKITKDQYISGLSY